VAPPLVRDAPAVAALAQIHLGAARQVRREVSDAALPALLPAVLATADLRRLRRVGFDPFAPAFARPDPWRGWRLARAIILRRY
jgi:hypothetical protein